MSVKMFLEILHNASFKEKISNDISFFDTLNRAGDFAKDSELLSTVAEFLALKVCHLQLEFVHKEMVDKSRGWGGEMWRQKDGKWATFVTEDEFLFLISIMVFHCGGFLRHHRWFLV